MRLSNLLWTNFAAVMQQNFGSGCSAGKGSLQTYIFIILLVVFIYFYSSGKSLYNTIFDFIALICAHIFIIWIHLVYIIHVAY